MPPKMSKASAAKEAKEKEKKLQKATKEAADASGVNIEELQLKIETLEAEKKKEEELRNYMQLERDKISAFWDISRRELESGRAELRNREREVEGLQEQHQIELKVYKQKLKHLMYEHQSNVATVKADGELLLKAAGEEAAAREQELLKDKRGLQTELREQAAGHQEGVRQLQLEHAKQASKMRQEVAAGAHAAADRYERRMRAASDEADARRRAETGQIEERAAVHAQALITTHAKELAEMKTYYNDVTNSNLDQIRALKEELAEARRARAAAEKVAAETAAENKRLVEPLAQAQLALEVQAKALEGQAKERAAAALTKSRLAATEKRLRGLEWEHEVLLQRFALVDAKNLAMQAAATVAAEEARQVEGARALLQGAGLRLLTAS